MGLREGASRMMMFGVFLLINVHTLRAMAMLQTVLLPLPIQCLHRTRSSSRAVALIRSIIFWHWLTQNVQLIAAHHNTNSLPSTFPTSPPPYVEVDFEDSFRASDSIKSAIFLAPPTFTLVFLLLYFSFLLYCII